MTFQLNSRYVLLTYAQCGELDPFTIVTLLSSLAAECIIGRELHSDQGIHLHAFVDFGRKYRTRNQRFADVEGCHPNIQPFGRTPEKGWDYAIKDGDVVAGGLERPDGGEICQPSDSWAIIAAAGSVDEFWSLARELAPRALLTSFNSLRAYAEWNFRPERTPYSTPPGISFDLSGYDVLNQWVQNNLAGDSVGKSFEKLHLLTGLNLRATPLAASSQSKNRCSQVGSLLFGPSVHDDLRSPFGCTDAHFVLLSAD